MYIGERWELLFTKDELAVRAYIRRRSSTSLSRGVSAACALDFLNVGILPAILHLPVQLNINRSLLRLR